MTFAEEIEAMVPDGETIEAIVVDPQRGGSWDRNGWETKTWGEVRESLDYTYDHGYGGADCHPILAWTQTRLIFVLEYDGATGLSWLPRNPTPCGISWGDVAT